MPTPPFIAIPFLISLTNLIINALLASFIHSTHAHSSQGLVQTCKAKPSDPVDFLAEWLFRHAPAEERDLPPDDQEDSTGPQEGGNSETKTE